MNFEKLFEEFVEAGKLVSPNSLVCFKEISWHIHPTFVGVRLKHIVTAKDTDGKFSFHLVQIAPHKKIGNHYHGHQLETHEVIAGSGICVNNGVNINYTTGVISILPMNQEHEVIAGPEGLYLFAKFIPALN